MTWIKAFVCILIAWISLFGSIAQATACPDMPMMAMSTEAQVVVGRDVHENLHNGQMPIATALPGFHSGACMSLSCMVAVLPDRLQLAVIAVSMAYDLPSNSLPDQFLPDVMPPPPRTHRIFI